MASQPLLFEQRGYGHKLKTAVASAASNRQLQLYRAEVYNGTNGTITTALCKKFAVTSASFKVFQLIAANTPDATEITDAIIAGTAATTIFTATNNDGFMVQCAHKFNVIGMTVDTAETGSPVYSYQYWNGSAWTTLTTIEVPTTYNTSASNIIAFQAPEDWVQGSDAATGGNLTGYYGIKVIATTHPSTAVKLGAAGLESSMWLAAFISISDLNSKASFLWQCPDGIPLQFDSGESVLPYFSGSANVASSLAVLYKNSG